MIRIISFLIFSLTVCSCVSTETVHKTPGSVKEQTDSAYNLEDADNSNTDVTGSFTLLLKRKDYGLTATRLILDFGEKSLMREDITENSFKVVDVNKSDDGVQLITGFSVTDRQGYVVETGRYITIDLDFVMDPDSVTAAYYIVTLNKDLGKYRAGTEFTQKGRTVRR